MLFLLVLFLAAGPPPSKHVRASLVSDAASVRPGQPLTVGLHLEMADGWHTYWKQPGDSGLATKMTWRLPEGFSPGPIRWPYPGKIALPPLMSYGYDRDVVLPVEIAVPASLPPGTDVVLAGRIDWLECREACIPGRAELELRLPVLDAAPAPGPEAARVAEALGRLPRPPAGALRAAVEPGRIWLSFEPGAPTAGEAYFFAADSQVVEHAAVQPLDRAGGLARLAVKRDPNAPVAPERLRGVLVVTRAGGPEATEVDVPLVAVAAAEAADPAPASAGGAALLVALASAFLGGLVLNLMPCVLPVLSLKVLSFVHHAGGDRRQAWRQGLAFTVGVLVSFWVLAGALLLLRASGEQVGWGFQLQSPSFVVFLAALFFLMGLSLFGVFEVGASLTAAGNLATGKTGLSASFWNGALATLVATPCTAPFMGSALGFALGQSVLVSFLVFTALGLGMASPYLLLALRPGLLRFVPRPGPWMEAFSQLMGFLLMATVVGLVWLFGRLAGVNGMALLLAALVIMGLGAWLYGRGTAPRATRRGRLVAVPAAGVLVLVGLLLALREARSAQDPAVAGERTVTSAGWEPFSPARVDELRAQGRPVLVDFTADWCLTCQVNERVALRSSAVQERLAAEDIALLKADWTRRDPVITAALASYGRQGVPVYVLYGRDPKGAPRLLPEVLTPALVLQALDETVAARDAAVRTNP